MSNRKLDLTPTGQSYFDSQRREHERIIENGKRFIKEQDKSQTLKLKINQNEQT
jgi:hypothetical protein